MRARGLPPRPQVAVKEGDSPAQWRLYLHFPFGQQKAVTEPLRDSKVSGLLIEASQRILNSFHLRSLKRRLAALGANPGRD